MSLNDLKAYAPSVLRYGIGMLMLWFGLTNTFSPETLVGYLSSSIPTFGVSPITIMFINGIVELVFAVLLLLGIFTRFAAFITAIHVFGIAVSLGYNDVAIRDFALAVASFAVFMNGSDKLCMRK